MRERCRVCQRQLRTERSMRREVGVKCYRKFNRGYRGVQVEQGESVVELKEKLECKA